MRRQLCLVATIAVLGLARIATAEEQPFEPQALGTRVSAQAAFIHGGGDSFLVGDVSAHVRVWRKLMVDVDAPLVYGATAVGGSGMLLGNFTVGAHAVLMPTPDIALNGGLAVALPTSPDPSNTSTERAWLVRAAPAGSANFDLYRFRWNEVIARIPLGIEARLVGQLFFRGEVNLDILNPSAKAVQKNVSILFGQADELSWHFPLGIRGGLGFQLILTRPAAFESNPASGDFLEAALVPFVAYEPPQQGFYARFDVVATAIYYSASVPVYRLEIGRRF